MDHNLLNNLPLESTFSDELEHDNVRKHPIHKLREGLSFVDAAFWLGLFALFVAVFAPLMMAQYETLQINTFNAALQNLHNKVKADTGNSSNYGTGMLNDTLRRSGAITRTYYSQNGNSYVYRNPWDGKFDVEAKGNVYEIILGNVPDGACSRWVTTPVFSKSDTSSFRVNGRAVDTDNASLLTADSVCNNDGDNEVTWVMN